MTRTLPGTLNSRGAARRSPSPTPTSSPLHTARGAKAELLEKTAFWTVLGHGLKRRGHLSSRVTPRDPTGHALALRLRLAEGALVDLGRRAKLPRRDTPLAYERPRPEATPLYEVVRDNLETLYAAVDEGALPVALPAFVKKELDGYSIG